MFVSLSIVEVESAGEDSLLDAFANRPRLVDTFPGFLGLEVFRDVHKRGRVYLLTRWASREDFQTYLKSDAFRQTHQQPHAEGHGAGLFQMVAVPC